MRRIALFLLPPLLCSVLLGLAGCSTSNQTTTERSATEQLLLSTAADRAAARLTLALPKGTRAYLNTADFDAIDGRYAIGAIRDSLLQQGINLVSDPATADTIIAVRSGALAIDQHQTLVGIPAWGLPIPLAGQLNTPEIALYKNATLQGVAKFAATAFDAKQGQLQDATGPQYGYSHSTENVVLFFIAWDTDDLVPDRQEDPRLNLFYSISGEQDAAEDAGNTTEKATEPPAPQRR